MPYAYFDLETTGVEADKCDFTCGVLLAKTEPRIFYTAVDMVTYMKAHPDFVYVTFNGLSFDFRVLAAQCAKNKRPDLAAFVAETAVGNCHVDLMFAFTAQHGYFSSLDSFAMQLGFKKSWNGAEAAVSKDVAAIVAYCTEDVNVMKKVHESALEKRYLMRASKMGRLSAWVLPDSGPPDVASVLNDLALMKPDQSWMTDPPTIPDAQMFWTTMFVQ